MTGVTDEVVMGNGTGSISPSPIKAPDDIRSKCAEIFAIISNQQSVMLGEIKDLRKDVKGFIKEQAMQGQDIRGLWKTIRNDIQPQVIRTREELIKGLSDHAEGCPARRKAMKRAESDSDNGIDTRPFRRTVEPRDDEPSQVIVVQTQQEKLRDGPSGIPWAAWIVGTSIAVATIIGMILAKQFGLF